MKKYLSRILVVEGKEDASYLSNFIDSEIVVINGYELDKEIISYLENRPVIIFSDPDEAGKIIRNKLNSFLKDAINIEIDIKKCTRGNKKGVAECEIDEVLSKLSEFCIEKPAKVQYFQISDLHKLGLSEDKELRKIVCKKLNFGVCNFKTFVKRLAFNNIKLDQVCEIIKEYKNGNK